MNIKEFISSLPWQTIFFCLIGVILIIISFFYSSGNKNLIETGITVDGIIYSLSSSNQGQDLTSVKDAITVRFLTLDKVWITKEYKANFKIAYTGQYKEGEAVKIIYDPKNPSRFLIKSKQSELIARLGFGFVGIASTIIGVYSYFKR